MEELALRVWDGDSIHYLKIEEMDDAITFRSERHFEGDVESIMIGIKSDDTWVFEGDLIRAGVKADGMSAARDYVHGEVVFEDGSFMVEGIADRFHLIDDTYDVEVQGNVYEGYDRESPTSSRLVIEKQRLTKQLAEIRGRHKRGRGDKTTLGELEEQLNDSGISIKDFTVTETTRKYFECNNMDCKSQVYEDYRQDDGYYYCLHCDEGHHEDEVKWK